MFPTKKMLGTKMWSAPMSETLSGEPLSEPGVVATEFEIATELDPEDSKLVTLARSARARNGTTEGAAVRDDTGRTYVATSVTLPSLALSAVQAAIVMAVASGADRLEAVALVTHADEIAVADRAVIADLGGDPIFVIAGYDGTVRSTVGSVR